MGCDINRDTFWRFLACCRSGTQETFRYVSSADISLVLVLLTY